MAELRKLFDEICEREKQFLFSHAFAQAEKLEEKYKDQIDARKLRLFHVLIASGIDDDECDGFDFEGEDSIERFIRNRHKQTMSAQHAPIVDYQMRETAEDHRGLLSPGTPSV